MQILKLATYKSTSCFHVPPITKYYFIKLGMGGKLHRGNNMWPKFMSINFINREYHVNTHFNACWDLVQRATWHAQIFMIIVHTMNTALNNIVFTNVKWFRNIGIDLLSTNMN